MPLITTDVKQVVEELRLGHAVALPTETVYGLAALIDQPHAIQSVFSIKKRPLNHPLIVHVPCFWDIRQLVSEIPRYAQQFIDAFWPGPLTLIFRCKPNSIDPLVNGGQTTIAIRCPAHPLIQRVLNQLNTPLVAPSANPFGKVSPTTALHVKASFPEESFLILDGGRCTVGIESTIIDATHDDSYQILRHGYITSAEIANVSNATCLTKPTTVRAPGLLENHYQPQKILYYFSDYESLATFCQQSTEELFVIASQKPISIPKSNFYPLATTSKEAAFNLYYQLRMADETNASCIIMELPTAEADWQGVRERIIKAGRPYSSLFK